MQCAAYTELRASGRKRTAAVPGRLPHLCSATVAVPSTGHLGHLGKASSRRQDLKAG